MRLLFVSHSLPPVGRPLDNLGGMQRVAIELHAALPREPGVEYDARVLRSSWKWIHVRTGPFLVGTWRLLRRRIRRGDLDVILFSSMVTASLAVPLSRALRKRGIRTAAIVHGLDVTTPFGPYQRFVRRVFGALDLVMPVSAATGQACVERGLDPARVRVVRNGVDPARFAPIPDARTARRDLVDALGDTVRPLPEDAFLLCSVGRQVARKGFAWFIEHVMPRLPASAHYWLAGDGPEHEPLRATVEANGLGDRVRLLGRVSEEDLMRLYRGADLFVMPNVAVEGDMEGFGVVMLEAGMNGLPVVAARLEGIAEVVTDRRNGQLVESGSVDGFVDAIARGAAAETRLAPADIRAFTETRFAWSSVARDYVAALSERAALRSSSH